MCEKSEIIGGLELCNYTTIKQITQKVRNIKYSNSEIITLRESY
jgi:hypothetical protein